LRKTSDDLIYVTDEGNNIIDCNFGPLADPETMAMKLSQKSGVIEHGLFLDLATDVIVAFRDRIEHKTKDQS
jgi:ribose 5-phosphate isomerase A